MYGLNAKIKKLTWFDTVFESLYSPLCYWRLWKSVLTERQWCYNRDYLKDLIVESKKDYYDLFKNLFFYHMWYSISDYTILSHGI